VPIPVTDEVVEQPRRKEPREIEPMGRIPFDELEQVCRIDHLHGPVERRHVCLDGRPPLEVSE
jgi:hypothetical protein